MSKARRVKTVRYVYEWNDQNGGTVMARVEFETHNSEWIIQTDVVFERAEAVGDSLINRLRRDMIL